MTFSTRSFRRLADYHSFSDEVPFPEVESSGATQSSENVLLSDSVAMKEDKTDSLLFPGGKSAFQQRPTVTQESVSRFRG
jgi:hypothetical protein